MSKYLKAFPSLAACVAWAGHWVCRTLCRGWCRPGLCSSNDSPGNHLSSSIIVPAGMLPNELFRAVFLYQKVPLGHRWELHEQDGGAQCETRDQLVRMWWAGCRMGLWWKRLRNPGLEWGLKAELVYIWLEVLGHGHIGIIILMSIVWLSPLQTLLCTWRRQTVNTSFLNTFQILGKIILIDDCWFSCIYQMNKDCMNPANCAEFAFFSEEWV